jgi:hypothetical protein
MADRVNALRTSTGNNFDYMLERHKRLVAIEQLVYQWSQPDDLRGSVQFMGAVRDVVQKSYF